MALTYEEVKEELENAVSNTEDFLQWTDEAIAFDIVDCSATFEQSDPEDLIPMIARWRAERDSGTRS